MDARLFIGRFSIANHLSDWLSEKTDLKAEKVFLSGKIVTMNPARPIAEAVAVRGDRIVRVGTKREIASLIDEKTEVVNLNGKPMLPGFIDAHIHVLDFGKTLQWLDLKEVKSLKELQSTLREQVSKSRRDRWIVGRDWSETRLKESRPPKASDLDTVSPHNPVVFFRENSLKCVVNSEALHRANITKSTLSPENGTIEKDRAGELTGILSGTATDLVWKKISEPDEDELADLAVLSLSKVKEAGITSIHWIALSMQEISAVRLLKAQGKLSVRVFLIVPTELIDGTVALKLKNDPMFRLGGGIIVTDGYLAARTAALSQPYAGESSEIGIMCCSRSKLVSEAKKVIRSKLQLVIQAMGDRAIDISLGVIDAVSECLPLDSFPFRLEQPAVLNPVLIERLKSENVVLSIQPRVAASEFVVWNAREHLGVDRVRWLYPLKTLSSAGVRIAGGSDCPMEPLNPLLGIQTAVTSDFHPEERLPVSEALRMYTLDAAAASKEDDSKGSIEEGKFADLVVLSGDPFSVDPYDIANIAVAMTIIGGEIVFKRAT